MTFQIKMRPEPSTSVHPPHCPAVPEGIRIYAVGDIHGRLDLLTQLQDAIDADLAIHPVRRAMEVYLGDFVDRGSQSAEVIDNLMARGAVRRTICLSGNHEDVMVQATESFETFLRWMRLGGLATVRSYVGEAAELGDAALWALWRQHMTPAHMDFLRALPAQFVCGDYVFVHAGVRPGVALEAQQRDDMLWIRNEFLSAEPDAFSHCVVHGHTPSTAPEVLGHRINVDTGAYATGHLSCIVLEGQDRFLLST